MKIGDKVYSKELQYWNNFSMNKYYYIIDIINDAILVQEPMMIMLIFLVLNH